MADAIQTETNNKETLSLKGAKVKTSTYSRGRMKITIKLSKDESEGYINFKKSVLPEGANEEDFVKTVFFMGLELFHKNAMSMLSKYVEENEESLRDEGVDVDNIKEVAAKLQQGISPAQEPEE